MSEQAGPYSVESLDHCSYIHGPDGHQISVDSAVGSHNVRAFAWCRLLNRAFAAGAASTPRPAGEAGLWAEMVKMLEAVEWVDGRCSFCKCRHHAHDCTFTAFMARLRRAQPPSGTGGQAVQAVIDAARAYIAEWEGAGLGSHRAASKLRDAVHALASLSTGGDAEGGSNGQ